MCVRYTGEHVDEEDEEFFDFSFSTPTTPIASATQWCVGTFTIGKVQLNFTTGPVKEGSMKYKRGLSASEGGCLVMQVCLGGLTCTTVICELDSRTSVIFAELGVWHTRGEGVHATCLLNLGSKTPAGVEVFFLSYLEFWGIFIRNYFKGFF